MDVVHAQAVAEDGLGSLHLRMVMEVAFRLFLLCGALLAAVVNGGGNGVARLDVDDASDAEFGGDGSSSLFAVLFLVKNDATGAGLQAKARCLPSDRDTVLEQ